MSDYKSERYRSESASKKYVSDNSDEFDVEGDEADDEIDDHIIPGTESTGRWTKEEHELFLEAIEKYGKVSVYSVFICRFFFKKNCTC